MTTKNISEPMRDHDGTLYRLNEGRPEPIDCEMPRCPNRATHAPTQGNGGGDSFLCDECHAEGVRESETW